MRQGTVTASCVGVGLLAPCLAAAPGQAPKLRPGLGTRQRGPGQADKYRAVIGDAVVFLKKLQWDEGDGKGREDDYYGGAGYDSKSRPDLSNMQTFLEGLKAAGVPPDDPAYQKALIFVSRCQNLK